MFALLLLRFVLTLHSTVDFGGGEGVGMWVCVRVRMWDPTARSGTRGGFVLAGRQK